MDLDYAIGGWHLQDQVSKVSDRHKLVQGWPAQNGVEGEADLCDVNQDALCAEVLGCPECDWERDTTA
jgi:hypothetical protein